MAQIPIGNLGNALANPAPALQAPAPSQIGEAVGRVAQMAMNEQARIGEQRQRTAAALALAKTTNDLNDTHDEVARGVLDGSISTDKAGAEFKTRANKITEVNFKGFDPDQQGAMQAHIMGVTGTLDRSLTGVVEKRNQQDTAGFIGQYGEQQSREAMRTGPAKAIERFKAMVQFSGGAAGLGPDQQAKAVQAFKEKVTYDFFDAAGVAALTQKDPNALGTLMQKVAGPEGDDMEPKSRTQLTHQLFGYQQHLLAQQDRARNAEDDEARKRFNAAVDVYNQGTDVALGGGYFSPDFIKKMTTTAAGTEMEPRVTALIASQRTVAGFASRPAAERTNLLERWRAARATPGVGTDPVDTKLMNAVEAMDTKIRKAADDNPWEAAQQSGVIQDAPIINPGDPAQAVAVLSTRMKDIGTIELWTGKRVSPFQPKEIETIGKMVRTLPVDQAASMLAQFGQTMGNDERVAAAAKQLHDKDGTLGLAMMFASAQTTEGRYTAELVLRGAQAEKDGTVKPDAAKETGWKADISKQIRGAYSNREVEDQTIRASFLIAGANGGDVDNAVRLATGGIVDRNGGKVPLPYGMKEGDFNKRIEALTPADFSAQAPSGRVRAGPAVLGVDEFVKTLQDARLMHAGQGRYAVRAGNTVVTNEQGKPVYIQVQP